MPDHLPTILAKEFGISTSEARRNIAQGAVRINGEVAEDIDVTLNTGDRVQLGKRREFIAEPVRREPGWVTHPDLHANASVAGWSREALDEKLAGHKVWNGPFSRVVLGRRQYFAFVGPEPEPHRSWFRRFFQKTP